MIRLLEKYTINVTPVKGARQLDMCPMRPFKMGASGSGCAEARRACRKPPQPDLANRGETRHTLARAICYGRRGEIRQPYREGQEEQLGVLGLVLNMVVAWNTLYLDQALAEVRRRGVDVLREDVERLSPLGFAHINFLGRYTFVLAERIRRGELLPLRTLTTGEGEEEGAEAAVVVSPVSHE